MFKRSKKAYGRKIYLSKEIKHAQNEDGGKAEYNETGLVVENLGRLL